MMKRFLAVLVCACACAARAGDDAPVTTETVSKTVASDGLFRRVTAEIVFSNTTARAAAADLVLPLPDGAAVCGYKLDVNGEMIPGVVCEKEKARVAFENEQRKGVDPGLVEHVKGNVWRTRVYPVPPHGTRRAEVTYVAEEETPACGRVVAKWGGYVYTAERTAGADGQAADLSSRGDAWILWDASRSRADGAAADLEKLKTLPEKGAWKVVVFRDVPEPARAFTARAELLAFLAAEPCDGGTDLAALLAAVPEDGTPKLLFSDEIDTLSLEVPALDARKDLVLASRPADTRALRVTRERRAPRADEDVKEDQLPAVMWAARYIADHADQAAARKKEFLELGRAFGVASPVTSLLVLETLEQWLEHKIEPPAELSFHAAWVKRRAAQDDPIAAKEAQAAFERDLLRLWKERVEWWNNPVPPKRTPKSGLFGTLARAVSGAPAGAASEPARIRLATAADSDVGEVVACESVAAAPQTLNAAKSAAAGGTGKSAAASVKLAAWDPKTPYLEALRGAKDAYAEYLVQAKTHGKSPAFFIDCAGWFFKAEGNSARARRVLSNLAEFALEEAALWRVAGWRLREAGAYDEAVRAFRHARRLRGEEGRSARDLALVLGERGRARMAADDLTEAMALFAEAAFTNHARRSARRSNDLQVAVVALEELNGLVTWCAARTWADGKAPRPPAFDDVFRREMPMDLRIVMSWDADETDIDIHVLEPDGEEAFYRHRRTGGGGFVGEDVTTGYGPEEYLRKDAQAGVYRVLSNYYASHQQKLLGAVTVTATVYTNWGRGDEARQILTMRLDKPKDKHNIGEITVK